MTKRLTSYKIWYSSCQVCGKQLTNHGSTRARSLCSNACRNKILRHRYKPTVRKPRKFMSQKDAHELVNNIKLQLGACVLHEFYHKGEQYLCTRDRLRAFCFDHIDREKKYKNVSAMIGRATKEQLLSEINKCWLVCANCHHMKTYENNDFKQITKNLELELRVIYDQPTLFDL